MASERTVSIGVKGESVEIHTASPRLLIALRLMPTRNDVAMEMGMPSEPLLPDDPSFEEKEELQEWIRRYFEVTEADPLAKYKAEWRVRFRWADAALSVMKEPPRA